MYCVLNTLDVGILHSNYFPLILVMCKVKTLPLITNASSLREIPSSHKDTRTHSELASWFCGDKSLGIALWFRKGGIFEDEE